MSSPTMTAVDTSPMRRLTITTATSMMFIGSRSCCSAIINADGGFSATMRFGPYFRIRAVASPAARPVPTSLDIAATTASASWVNHGRRSPVPTTGFASTALVVSVMWRLLSVPTGR
jgi:hypothetical protein